MWLWFRLNWINQNVKLDKKIMSIVWEYSVYKDGMCKNKYNHIDDWCNILCYNRTFRALNTNSGKKVNLNSTLRKSLANERENC